MDVTLAIDAMGGDHSVSVTLPAAVEYLKQNTRDTIILVGIPDVIETQLRSLGVDAAGRPVRPASAYPCGL